MMSWIIAVSQYLLLVFLLAIAVALTMMATLFCQLKFKLVAQRYHVPVEVVILCKNYFKVGVLGTTKKIEVQARTNIDYDYSELIG